MRSFKSVIPNRGHDRIVLEPLGESGCICLLSQGVMTSAETMTSRRRVLGCHEQHGNPVADVWFATQKTAWARWSSRILAVKLWSYCLPHSGGLWTWVGHLKLSIFISNDAIRAHIVPLRICLNWKAGSGISQASGLSPRRQHGYFDKTSSFPCCQGKRWMVMGRWAEVLALKVSYPYSPQVTWHSC